MVMLEVYEEGIYRGGTLECCALKMFKLMKRGLTLILLIENVLFSIHVSIPCSCHTPYLIKVILPTVIFVGFCF